MKANELQQELNRLAVLRKPPNRASSAAALLAKMAESGKLDFIADPEPDKPESGEPAK